MGQSLWIYIAIVIYAACVMVIQFVYLHAIRLQLRFRTHRSSSNIKRSVDTLNFVSWVPLINTLLVICLLVVLIVRFSKSFIKNK